MLDNWNLFEICDFLDSVKGYAEMRKALSIRQPWANLIVTGIKTIEIRTWRPKTLVLPQIILIHAGKKVDEEALKCFGIKEDLPTGAIVGEALMTGVKQYSSRDQWLEELEMHRNRPESFQEGLYGFVLKDYKQYAQPIPLKGQLNFFDVDI